MSKVRNLLKLAQDCYAQARVTINRETKRALTEMGDNYLKEADELRRGRSVVRAAYPKSGSKIGGSPGSN